MTAIHNVDCATGLVATREATTNELRCFIERDGLIKEAALAVENELAAIKKVHEELEVKYPGLLDSLKAMGLVHTIEEIS